MVGMPVFVGGAELVDVIGGTRVRVEGAGCVVGTKESPVGVAGAFVNVKGMDSCVTGEDVLVIGK